MTERRVIYEDNQNRVSIVTEADGVWIHSHSIVNAFTHSVKVPAPALADLGAALLVDGKIRDYLK